MRNLGQIIHTIEELISAIKENRNIAEIKQIISGIEDINQADKDGRTALYGAAFNGHVEIVAQLLAAGADVNKADYSGSTALYWAALKGYTEIISHLLAYGADETSLTEADQKNLKIERIIKKILTDIKVGYECPVLYGVLIKDGRIGGERAFSTGGKHLYQENAIRELLKTDCSLIDTN